MNTFKKILIVFSVLLIVISAIGLIFFDEHVHAERTIVVNVPRSEMYQILNTHKTFNEWSPWLEKDPSMKITYSGSDRGVGAKYSWSSPVKEVGVGSMEIVESVPDSVIRQRLTFEGRGSSETGFILRPEGNGTRVIWMLDMDAGANPIKRILGGFMDRMIGPDFEKGLTKLKAYSEKMHSASVMNQ